MFFIPKHPATGRMWDTWLYLHEGTFHLYYLANAGERWDNISMATSVDGVRWAERGPVLVKRPEVTWMGTGSTWPSPVAGGPGRFQMNFSEWEGPRQTIFFAASDDLLHWERLGREYEFVQDERWYAPLGRWDCIWTIPAPDGGLLGYWTATPKPETGGRFGFGRSLDGVTWEALPPPEVHGAGEGEVGAVERIGDRYHMMFGNYPDMVTLVAERPEGPFRAGNRNRSLLSGHTYFSRFLATPDSLLVNHHSIARDGRVFMGLLKEAAVDGEGTMRLRWWRGNDLLKGPPTRVPVAGARAVGGVGGTAAATAPAASDGLILECSLLLPPTPYDARRGISIECAEGVSVAILFDAQGRAEFSIVNGDGSTCTVEKRADREAAFGRPAHLRLAVQETLMELYLDDLLIECYSLPSPATGGFGVICGGIPEAVTDLRAYRPA